MSQRSTRNIGGAVLLVAGTLAVFALLFVPGASLGVLAPLAIGGVLAMAAGTLLLGVGGSDGRRVA